MRSWDTHTHTHIRVPRSKIQVRSLDFQPTKSVWRTVYKRRVWEPRPVEYEIKNCKAFGTDAVQVSHCLTCVSINYKFKLKHDHHFTRRPINHNVWRLYWFRFETYRRLKSVWRTQRWDGAARRERNSRNQYRILGCGPPWAILGSGTRQWRFSLVDFKIVSLKNIKNYCFIFLNLSKVFQ